MKTTKTIYLYSHFVYINNLLFGSTFSKVDCKISVIAPSKKKKN